MNILRDASPYGRGKRLMIGAMVIVPVIMWGVPLASTASGLSGETILHLVMWLAFGWFIIVGVSSVLIGCPKCGRPVFMRRFGISVPWPARTCSGCGTDLTTISRPS